MVASPSPPNVLASWRGTAMGRVYLDKSWAATPVGDPADWPDTLTRMVSQILHSGFPMFVVWGPQRAILYNEAYTPILGLKHPDALGRPFGDVWAEVKDQIDPIIDAAFEGRASFFENLEVTLVRVFEPEAAWFTFSYSPIVDLDGSIPGALCVCVETTTSVMAHEALQEAQSRQRQMFDQAPGFICILHGPQHTYEFVNQAYRDLFGNRNYVVATVRDCFPELKGQGFYELLDQVFSTGERFHARAVPATVWSGETSESLVLDFVYEPLRDRTGKVTGIFCEGFDITVEHFEREVRRRSEARLRFLDALGNAVAVLTSADDILAATTRMVGEHLDISCCAYADMDEDQDGFTIRGDWSAPGSPSIVGHYSLADFGKLAVKNLGAGEPLIVNDNLAELAPEEAKTFQDIGISATICMPLVKEGRLTALMAIHDRKPHRWTEDELDLIREVTGRSWAHVERVGAQAELKSSNDRFRAAVEAVKGVVWTNDAEGRMTGDQPGWSAITGQTSAEYQGYGWLDVVHPEDSAPTLEAWQERR